MSKMVIKFQKKTESTFSKKDIEKWCAALDIPVEKIGDYFFAY